MLSNYMHLTLTSESTKPGRGRRGPTRSNELGAIIISTSLDHNFCSLHNWIAMFAAPRVQTFFARLLGDACAIVATTLHPHLHSHGVTEILKTATAFACV